VDVPESPGATTRQLSTEIAIYFIVSLSHSNENIVVVLGALEALSGWLTDERASVLPRDYQLSLGL
jgi:hypothetical protein